MRHVLAITLALTAASVLGASAYANPVTIVNSGFETPATHTTAAPTGWTSVNTGATGLVGSYNPYTLGGGNVYYTGANSTTDPANGGSGYPGIFGENLGFATDVSAGSGLEQTLSATFLANTAYTLTVQEGNRNGTSAGGFAGSVIQLLAGSTVIASSTDTAGPTAGTLHDQVALLANSNIDSALFGQTLSINILTTNAAAVNRGSDWDNVRLDATTVAVAVPLPPAAGTGALLLAMLGLGWRRRKAGIVS
jgi:hypothetical protein